PERLLAQKFGIDGNVIAFGEGVAECGQLRSGGNGLHWGTPIAYQFSLVAISLVAAGSFADRGAPAPGRCLRKSKSRVAVGGWAETLRALRRAARGSQP